MTKTKKYFGYVYYEFIEDYVHIYNLYVYKKYRGLGKSKILLKEVIDKIKLTGWNKEICIVAIPRENCMTQNQLIEYYKRFDLEVYTYYG